MKIDNSTINNTKYSHLYVFRISLLLIAFVLLLSPSAVLQAASGDLSYTLPAALKPVVEDRADIFTDYEEVTIEDKFSKLRDISGYQYIFMTVSDTKNYVKGREVENMYNQYNDELYGTGTVLFLISTDSEYPICEIQAYSKANQVFDHETCSYISDTLKKYVENKQYSECMDNFFTLYNKAADGTLEITNTIDTSDSTKLILMLCLSILITAILAAIIYSKAFTGTAKENASDSAIIGKCTYRFKLTKNKITYIRSCK